jgi:cytidylate kinase
MDLGVESAPDGRTKVLVADADISAELRTPELEQLASQVSTHAEVRRKLVELQRRIAQAGGVVMEGRDIQTVVLPDADVKVFLTASVDERACRRMKDLEAAGEHASLAEVRRQIEARDRRDETRAASPLRAAPDAVTIDTDNLSVEQVVGRIIALVQR